MYDVVLMNNKTNRVETIRVEASSHGEAWERARKALEFSGKNVKDYHVKTSRKIAEDHGTKAV